MSSHHPKSKMNLSSLSRYRSPLAFTVLVALVLSLWTVFRQEGSPANWTSPTWFPVTTATPPLLDLYARMWKQEIHDEQIPANGTIHSDYTFARASRVCAFTSDSRPLQGSEELAMSNVSRIVEDWPFRRDYVSLSYWRNSLWAYRHGYRFTKISPNVPGRISLWNKVQGIITMSEDSSCEYLVFMDSDVYVKQANFSLTDLRLRWGMTDRAIMMLPKDVSEAYGGWNTGLLFMKNGPRLKEILQDWWKCPEETEGCEHYLKNHPGDQGAFDKFLIRPLIESGDVVVAPCDESNGNTVEQRWGCRGTIFTHGWGEGKHRAGVEIVQVLAAESIHLAEMLRDASLEASMGTGKEWR